ncbi:radical SAM protein [bacterium]|nr:radical SAM protein [bacterium]
MRMPFFKALKHTTSFYARDAMGWRIRPLKLRLAITNRCNARCRMCNAWKADNAPADEFRLDEYAKLFTNSAGYLRELRHVSLTGGEPTLRKDLPAIARLIQKHKPALSLNVNTNGFLTDRLATVAGDLADDKIVITWNISLDGLGEIHDTMRGIPHAGEMAGRSLQALKALKEAGKDLRIGVNHLICDETARETEKVYEYCRENRFAFHPILPVAGQLYDNETMRFSLSQENREALTRLFRRLIREVPAETLAWSEIMRQIEGQPRDFRCWAGHVLLLIEENGEVYPNGGCPREWRFGNLRGHRYDLEDLMQTEQATNVREEVRKCRSCQLACETLTTLRYPEALTACRKLKKAS